MNLAMTSKDLSPEQKKEMRKVKKVSDQIKVAMYKGNTPPVCMQFNDDVRLYGLYEAVLYIEGYEKDGMCAAGTAARVIEAFVFPSKDDEEEGVLFE